MAEIGPTILEPFNKAMSDFASIEIPRMKDDFTRDLATAPSQGLIEQVMTQGIAAWHKRVEQETANFNAQMVSLFVRMLIPPVFMKHPAFGAENEWRIAQFSYGNISGIRFRPGTFSLVPYVAIPLPCNEPVPDLRADAYKLLYARGVQMGDKGIWKIP